MLKYLTLDKVFNIILNIQMFSLFKELNIFSCSTSNWDHFSKQNYLKKTSDQDTQHREDAFTKVL